MKHKFFIGLAASAAVVTAALGFAACGKSGGGSEGGGDDPPPAPHEHTFSPAWSSDDAYHWHAATCEHEGETSGKAKHTYEKGVCTECLHAHVDHTFEGDTCTVCGYALPSSKLSYEEVLGEDGQTVTGYSVSGWDESETDRTRLVVPAEYEGKPVVSIGENAFEGETQLKEVYLPATVKTLGHEAFLDCGELSEAEFPSVENVAAETFGHCTKLRKAAFGKIATWGNPETSVRQNCYFVFDGCTALESVSVAAGSSFISSEGGVLYNEEKTEVLFAPRKLQGVVRLPATIVTVGNFADCTEITEVIVPEGAKEIAGLAFSRCTKLRKVNIPESVTSIPGDDPFKDCESLETENEGGVRYLDRWAIGYAGETEALHFRGDTRGISGGAFAGCAAKEIVVPESVIYIGWGAFEGCSQLREITVPFLGVTLGATSSPAFERIFGYYAGILSPTYGKFAPSTLKKVTVTGDVALTKECFYKCKYIEEIVFEGKVTAIESKALAEMAALKTIVYAGTTEEWIAIEKGNKWADKSNFTVQCENGSVSTDDTVIV